MNERRPLMLVFPVAVRIERISTANVPWRHIHPNADRNEMTFDEAKQIVLKYVAIWNASYPASPLWALVTGVKAGMHFRFNGYFIIVNSMMTPESIVTTFFHEYGHANYERERGGLQNVADSEVAAIRSSLQLCAAEGFEDLAYREAEAVKRMAVEEPYRSAVEKLKEDPIWRQYARL